MIKRFLDYVEIKTKITSVLTFTLTTLFLAYKEIEINWALTSIFFASMLLFDLTTTAINNYIDTKTNTQILQFKRANALAIIYILFALSTALGLWLAVLTDLVVLIVGGICFLAGVFYTYGPIPISRQPLGEFFSGLFYGLLIPFLIFYINMPKGEIIGHSFNIETWEFSLTLGLVPIFELLLFAIIPFASTANIMLTNNICDLEKDVLVKRYTLPYYLGKKSLWLYISLTFAPFLAIILLIMYGFFPLLLLGILLIIPLIFINMKQFLKVQDKATTFNTSIKNFILTSVGCILLFVVQLIIF